MRLRQDQLPQQLSKQLLPVYLVSGDELLLRQESCDLIRRHCRDSGFGEREVYEVDNSFDWGRLSGASHELSLFAERKLIELRLTGKAGKEGSAALCDYLEHADDSNVLLISCPRMDRSALNAKWAKAVDKAGAVIQVWPVDRAQLPRWLDQRFKAAGLNADRQALELLADRVEGNLLAAAQEVEKLRVLSDGAQISADMVAATVASSARYDVFKLIDNALKGDAATALHMLHSLQAEGAEGIPLLGAISREIRILFGLASAVAAGGGIERALDEARVWDKRKPLYKAVLQRLPRQRLGELLQNAARIDLAQKGQSPEDPWLLLGQLVAALAGRELLGG